MFIQWKYLKKRMLSCRKSLGKLFLCFMAKKINWENVCIYCGIMENGHSLRCHWKVVIHWGTTGKRSFIEVPLESSHSLRYQWKAVIYWGTTGKIKHRKANTTKDLDNSSTQQWTRLSWADRNNYASYILQSCIDVMLISHSAGSA